MLMTSLCLDEEAIYDFATELHQNTCPSDPTYARALALFGEKGVIDLTAVCGHYTLIAMILNLARTALPAGAKPASTLSALRTELAHAASFSASARKRLFGRLSGRSAMRSLARATATGLIPARIAASVMVQSITSRWA